MADVVAQLMIVMTADGQVNVNGPIDNKVLSYGLLEIAKEVINEHNKSLERRVQPASAAERLALGASMVKP